MNKSLYMGALGILLLVSAPVFAEGDAAAGKAKSVTCGACHGANGEAMIPEYPNLAGQGAGYLIKQLQDFKSGARSNPLMGPMAAPLNDQDIADLAAYYEGLPAKAGVATEENLAFGESLYRGGVTSIKVAACTGCHGPDGAGNPAANYPAVSGQNMAYVSKMLKDFRATSRTNDPNNMMRSVAHRLSDNEIAALSNYIQGLH